MIEECDHLSPAFKNLIVSLIAYKPSERLSLEDLRQHTWLRKKEISIQVHAAKVMSEPKMICLNQKTNLKRNLIHGLEKKSSNPVAVEVKITVPITAVDLSETKRKLQQTFN